MRRANFIGHQADCVRPRLRLAGNALLLVRTCSQNKVAKPAAADRPRQIADSAVILIPKNSRQRRAFQSAKRSLDRPRRPSMPGDQASGANTPITMSRMIRFSCQRSKHERTHRNGLRYRSEPSAEVAVAQQCRDPILITQRRFGAPGAARSAFYHRLNINHHWSRRDKSWRRRR